MRALALPLACVLLLAGCLGPEEPTTPAAEGGDADGAPAGDASPASSAQPKADASARVGAGGQGAASSVVSTPLSWDGSVGTGLCLPTGPGSCMGPGLPVGDEDDFLPLEGPGNETRVDAALTWDPTTPGTQELDVLLLAYKSCGDRCRESRILEVFTGASPLAISADIPPLEADEAFGLRVSQTPLTPDPIYAYVHLEQPFHLEGILLSTA